MTNKYFFNDDFLWRVNEIYNKANSRAEKKIVKKLVPEIVNSADINAYAMSDKDNDYISINYGMTSLISEYLDVFSKEYNFNMINKFHSFEIDHIDDNLFEGIIQKNDSYQIFSNSSQNKYLSLLCFTYIERFIITHEMGHIFNGHTEYMGQEYNLKKFSMFFKSSVTNKMALDIRTLEYDADSFAATETALYLIDSYNNFEEIVSDKLLMYPKNIFFWWFFSIRLFFLILEYELNDFFYNDEITYLPSVHRFSTIFSTVFEILEFADKNKIITYRDEDSLISFAYEIERGINDAETFFNKNKKTDYNWSETLNSDTNYSEYLKEIKSNWAKISSEIEKYSRMSIVRRLV